jgi:uncharacterized membrane protein YtjA (UPF0391 family)
MRAPEPEEHAMIRWALVSFVIAIVAAFAALTGNASAIDLDIAIAAFLFGAVVFLVSWISRDELAEEEEPKHTWSH